MRIVVATDGSRGGTAAVKFALRLAARDAAAEVIVLTIGAPLPANDDGDDTPPVEGSDGIRQFLPRERESAIGGIPVRYRHVVTRRQEAIPETIAREGDRLKADLLVVGSEGRDTLSEWVLGGVALRLIYVARRPVTVVRPPRRRRKLLAAV